ncbi:MAG: hypothetical protein KF871_09375 [Hydrogenophaga sp.]|uniref:hypothetical protein n=1 Tax=Hydrogenophaga sp. TaxID=1904254 RepID=UPI001D26419B|nr:hypothetical protein [Hydrogenophaga sp.]MBX3610096.1 hypothetical protein [Hydrogenophaga sp.]
MSIQPGAKPFVFVLMPFDSAFDDIYRYGIKRACEEQGCYCERVDEQMFDGSILDRIYHQIRSADVVVADLTGRNANVFYETGYAHGLGKRVILLTQRQEDIPFDLRHYHHIVYGGRIADLATELGRRIAWALAQAGGAGTSRHSVRYSIQGVQVADDVQTDIVEYSDEGSGVLSRVLQIDVINDSERVVRKGELDIGVILESFTGAQASRLDDGRYWHVITDLGDIFPGSLRAVKLHLQIPNGADHRRLTTDGVRVDLKEISSAGQRSFRFFARLRSRDQVEHARHFVPPAPLESEGSQATRRC